MLLQESQSFFLKDYLFGEKKDSLKRYTSDICSSIVRNCFDQLQRKSSNFEYVKLDDNLAVAFDFISEKLEEKNAEIFI